jgi:hypothetical protein
MPLAYGAVGDRDAEAGGARYIALHSASASLYEPVQVPKRAAWKRQALVGVTSVVAASLLLVVVLQAVRGGGGHPAAGLQGTAGQASLEVP